MEMFDFHTRVMLLTTTPLGMGYLILKNLCQEVYEMFWSAQKSHVFQPPPHGEGV